ncbi:MAG: helix-turn-helix transcriptional regulator [Bacteroidetes bacterium]|nr:helix-turn-helix transcriptional regulator [Bacteroidota bacterium]
MNISKIRKGDENLIKKFKVGKYKNITTFEDLLNQKYGKVGTPERDRYDAESLAFRLGVMLREARENAKMTQEELADKTGTKKSYISRIERGKSDIQMTTYYKLIETGLGKRLQIFIQ